MPKSTRNNRNRWSPQDLKQLSILARQNTPTRVIGLKLGRTAAAVQAKASSIGLSLMPANRSPYGRRH